jgi:hypothetical protein
MKHFTLQLLLFLFYIPLSFGQRYPDLVVTKLNDSMRCRITVIDSNAIHIKIKIDGLDRTTYIRQEQVADYIWVSKELEFVSKRINPRHQIAFGPKGRLGYFWSDIPTTPTGMDEYPETGLTVSLDIDFQYMIRTFNNTYFGVGMSAYNFVSKRGPSRYFVLAEIRDGGDKTLLGAQMQLGVITPQLENNYYLYGDLGLVIRPPQIASQLSYLIIPSITINQTQTVSRRGCDHRLPWKPCWDYEVTFSSFSVNLAFVFQIAMNPKGG